MPEGTTEKSATPSGAGQNVEAAAASGNASANSGPSPAVMATYARQNIVFERGEGSWLITSRRRALSRLRLRRRRQRAGPCPSPSRCGPDRTGRQALAHLEPLSGRPARNDSPNGCARRHSPTRCSSAIPARKPARARSRPRGAIISSTATPERWRIITFAGAFHGRTLATLVGSRQPEASGRLRRAVDGFDHVPFGDHDAIESCHRPQKPPPS